jgi:hypothetical protein
VEAKPNQNVHHNKLLKVKSTLSISQGWIQDLKHEVKKEHKITREAKEDGDGQGSREKEEEEEEEEPHVSGLGKLRRGASLCN